MDTVLRQLQALQEEVRHLSDRLTVLEGRQGVATTSQPSPPVAAPPSPPQPAVKTEALPTQPREWEQILGANWLARVGILALIIGVGFFLKFAFDQNWLGPTGRVILGIIGGLAMLSAGRYWHKRYPIFAQTLSGGGIALLYLSLFAAFALFAIIGFYLAVALILLVSAGAAVLALGYNSMALAIIGIIGAFIAPFILVASAARASGAAQTAQSLWLLVYVMVVDIGVLWLSTFRNWRWFTRLALVGSLAVFVMWYDRFGDTVGLGISMGSLTILFLIFVGATTLYHIVWRRPPQALDYALMLSNAAAYFGISYGLMWRDLEAWLGGFALLLALFYGGLAYVSVRRGAERLAFFALGIALVFLMVAIPVQFGDKAWTTIAWAALGTVLVWLSFRVRLPELRVFGYAVFVVMVVRLLLFDTTVTLSAFRPVFNERFLAFGVSIVALYLAAYFLWRDRDNLAKWQIVMAAFLVAANFLTVWLLSFELWNHFDTQLARAPRGDIKLVTALRNARNLSLTALWTIYAVILLVVGIVKCSPRVRLGALALLIVPIVKVFVYDVFALQQVYRIIAFTGLGFLLLVSAYLYQRYSQTIKGFLIKP